MNKQNACNYKDSWQAEYAVFIIVGTPVKNPAVFFPKYTDICLPIRKMEAIIKVLGPNFYCQLVKLE
jgi:hypothetical protein